MSRVNERPHRKLAFYAKIVKAHGGKLLTKGLDVVRYHDRLKVQCRRGHKWEPRADSLRGGSWCPKCPAIEKRVSIADVRALAVERGGRLLSAAYKNNESPLEWICDAGHVFKSNWANVISGRWCPRCSESRSERITRAHFEQLFKKKFPKVRPIWLRKSNAKTSLELDGYCEELKLAFEHQGEHHYRSVNYNGSVSGTDVRKQRRNDKLKRKVCEENGVTIVEVPQLGRKLGVDELKAFIVSECKKHGIALPKGVADVEIDIGGAYTNRKEIERLAEIRAIAKERNAALVSDTYVDAKTPLDFKCLKCGHEWPAVYHQIKRSGCRKCGLESSAKKQTGQLRRNGSPASGGTVFEDACEKAFKKGIECRSQASEYVSAKAKMDWHCLRCGRDWATSCDTICQGKGCRVCEQKKVGERRRHTIQSMHALAADNGGRCLSKQYHGGGVKLRWECGDCGKPFEAAPDNVLHGGSWCPSCRRKQAAEKRRLGIDEMHRLAKAKKGRCLSGNYGNGEQALVWQCHKGHKPFRMSGHTVKSGQWCPVCGREKVNQMLKERSRKARQLHAVELNCDWLGTINEDRNEKTRWRHRPCGTVFLDTPEQMRVRIARGIRDFCKYCKLKAYGEERGCELISKKYVDSDTAYMWKSVRTGKRFKATQRQIRQNALPE